MLTFVASGLLLGLSCGLAPGPLLALVVAQTLRHGPQEGCKVALTPLMTDAPIVLAALLVASNAAHFHRPFGILSILGGVFVLYLAWDTAHPASLDPTAAPMVPNSWLKGILTNFLSPHPWLFWMTVGSALLGRAILQGLWEAIAFLAGFYLLLVGSKILVALLAARFRGLLSGRPYRLTLRVLALVLALFGLLLFREGWRQLALT